MAAQARVTSPEPVLKASQDEAMSFKGDEIITKGVCAGVAGVWVEI